MHNNNDVCVKKKENYMNVDIGVNRFLLKDKYNQH